MPQDSIPPILRSRPKPAARDIAGRLVGRTQSTKETATLQVDNQLFTDWTSIRVEHRFTEAYPTFQFECTEESPMPVKIPDLQFHPGQIVDVWLGNQQVLHGYITERHVAYDATTHAIRLI